MPSAIESLTAERDDLAQRLRQIATNAELKNDGNFTPAEITTVNDLKSQFMKVTADLDRAKSLADTQARVGEVLHQDDDDPASARSVRGGAKAASRASRNPTPLGRSIAATLFGSKGGLGSIKDHGRQFFDPSGGPDRRMSAVTAMNTRSGFVSVPTLRTADGNSVFLLPENGARITPLLSPVPVNDGTYRFRRQTGRDDFAAGFVPERTPKPSTPFEYEMVTDRVRTVAVLSDPLSRQELADVPGLPDDVGNELARRVIRQVDWGIINGDQDAVPTDDQFDGVLNTEGVQDVAFATDALTVLRKALTVLQNDAFTPTAYTISPTDWESIELLRDADGRLLYADSFSTGVVPRLFGVPVVIADVVPAGTAILADWRAGVLAERGQIDLAWSDGGSLFETNTVRFRAEVRVGFNITQPTAFVVAHVAA